MIDTSGLNANQKEAVLSEDKYLRIIAGAGSGKTRVLTMHIAHLIQDCHVFPTKILAITFTNKAANEMKDRVRNMLEGETANPFISTIHSLCVRILREDIGVLGWPRNFTVIDAEDQKSILKDAYKQFGLETGKFPYGGMLNYISNNKTEEISVDRAKILAGRDPDECKRANVYEYYLLQQKKMYALDFDDLILETVKMFRSFEEVVAKWQRRFHYIMVDEFQDIDKLQYQLIRQLTGQDNNLLVVGDPDQTIYTWRGADVNIIMNFMKDFEEARTIVLAENYRSTQPILNGANSVIKNNRHRVDKDLFTTRTSEEKITHYAAPSDEYQAMWIASKMKELHQQGKKYRDMAVLYRSNYLSRSLEKGLLDARVPYIIYGGVRFYERMEVKDALSYLRLVVVGDDLAFNRVVNKPKRGIGNKTMDTIAQLASQDETTMYEAVKNHLTAFKGKSAVELGKFVRLVEKWRLDSAVEGVEIYKLFERIIDESGYREMLEADKENERLENLKELIDDVRQFTKDYPESTLDEYLQMVSLYGDREEVMDGDFVQLMTVHAAKGLEFDTVFVTDLNEGIFPNERAMNDGLHGVEEERRLAYVAYTRARNKLFLTEAGGFSFILQRVRTRSRFINEIDEEWIEHVGNQARGTFATERKLSSALFDDRQEPVFSALPKKKTSAKWTKGDHVTHPKFGEGVVTACDSNIVSIAFPYPHGVKKIAAGFPGLKKVVN